MSRSSKYIYKYVKLALFVFRFCFCSLTTKEFVRARSFGALVCERDARGGRTHFRLAKTFEVRLLCAREATFCKWAIIRFIPVDMYEIGCSKFRKKKNGHT